MDFGTLLHMAKKNSQSIKDKNSPFYSTKYAPPKKVSKEKKLSDNIEKFLQKREQEERERKRQEKEKLNHLLSMRDEKSKNKIRKMLKVTKSANKSVLDDCHGSNTAVTFNDQDDYGYVSTEANAFYQKYIEKVKDVKEDKGFAPSRPLSTTDLKGTKERVKAAITREADDKKGSKHRSVDSSAPKSSVSFGSSSSSSSGGGGSTQTSIRTHVSSKTLYDPAAEKQEEERRKREEDQKRAKQRKPPPPIMDFQALLKLAEKKQHEPIEVPVEVKKPKEPERLLTSKEKRELEERKRLKEARERREKMQKQNGESSTTSQRDRKETAPAASTMEPNGRIPKIGQTVKPGNNSTSALKNVSNTSPTSASKSVISTKSSSSSSQISNDKLSKKQPSKPETNSTNSGSSKLQSPSGKSSISSMNNTTPKKITTNGSLSASTNKKPYEGPTREFPPRDIKTMKARPFPPPDVRRPENRQNNKSKAQKRRIIDDDDEEYDSEMDDFIDDDDVEEDYSKHIKAIFGYDKSKYRQVDDDDMDDRAMESNFAQVQREEYISKKIGLQEDLEDMRMEALEKKQKMAKKKKIR